jgi:hypothetical protein
MNRDLKGEQEQEFTIALTCCKDERVKRIRNQLRPHYFADLASFSFLFKFLHLLQHIRRASLGSGLRAYPSR